MVSITTIRRGIQGALGATLRVSRRGMTLVEVMVALAAFTIAILGGLSVMFFNLKTMDQVRANTQMTQLLMNEMEAMRMRTWEDRAVPSAPGGVLYGIKSLGMGRTANGTGASLTGITTDNEQCDWAWSGLPNNAGAWYTVTPFAVYGTAITAPAAGKIVAKVGEDVAAGSVQMRIPASNLTLSRYVVLVKSDWGDPLITEPDMARIYLRAQWSDARGTHDKSISTTVSRYGINDYITRSVPEAAP